MGIQYFVSLSGEKLAFLLMATCGSTNTTTLILQGFGEQLDQYFLTFM
jgi:hypothetical protein